MSIVCGENYPEQAPQIRFNSKINIPCVNQSTGVVEQKFHMFANWNPKYTLEAILIGIKTEMINNKKLP
jgi:ubiquitin-conjugating enzyme E2 variant